ncbi:MAG TPA: glycosyltransferase [Actinomycetota bacterium]|nr:glycosyltransferase [Actinomycetota bacterium]
MSDDRSPEDLPRELARRAAELEEREFALARREAAALKRELGGATEAPDMLAELPDLETRLFLLQQFYDRVTRSRWYRAGQATRRAVDATFPWGTRRRQLIRTPVRAAKLVRDRGLGAGLSHLLRLWVWVPNMLRPALPVPHSRESYEVWHRRRFARGRRRTWRRDVAALSRTPRFSIVMPAYNSEPRWLRDAVRSIRAQAYPHWQLCIADDASTRPETLQTLRGLDATDARITVRFLTGNRGISGCSNAALELATGEFVALLDHDDELKPDALLEVARLLDEHPELDYVYTDEDKRGLDGRLSDVFFKPDWSPDLLLSMNYLSHLSVFRREAIERVGGFRSEFDGSQDYDLVLRVTETTDRIGHVSLPLYTWRMAPGSAAVGEEAKPWAYTAARRAVEDAVRRRGIAGEVEYGPFVGSYRVSYEILGEPRVVILVDGDETVGEGSLDVRRVDLAGGSFASRMNEAAEAGADVLVFVGPGLPSLDAASVRPLVEHALRPEVGVVGPRVLFGPLAFQGVIVADGEAPGAWRAGRRMALGEVVRNCAAVSGHCLAVRADVFRELGGFEESMGPVLGPVDLCLRAGEKGHLVVYTPEATLRWEGPMEEPTEEERERFRARWAGYRDPYYNPNLDPADPGAIAL